MRMNFNDIVILSNGICLCLVEFKTERYYLPRTSTHPHVVRVHSKWSKSLIVMYNKYTCVCAKKVSIRS